MYGLTLQRCSVYIPTSALAQRVLKVTIPLGAFTYGTIRPSGCEELKVYTVHWCVMYAVKCVCWQLVLKKVKMQTIHYYLNS